MCIYIYNHIANYHLVNVYITMENHHAINGIINYKWPFSSSQTVSHYQAGYLRIIIPTDIATSRCHPDLSGPWKIQASISKAWRCNITSAVPCRATNQRAVLDLVRRIVGTFQDSTRHICGFLNESDSFLDCRTLWQYVTMLSHKHSQIDAWV